MEDIFKQLGGILEPNVIDTKIENIATSINERIKNHEAELYAIQMMAKTKEEWIACYRNETGATGYLYDREAIKQDLSSYEELIIKELDDMLMHELITEEQCEYIKEQCDLN